MEATATTSAVKRPPSAIGQAGITKERIVSIDILRALTMILMIFVNDLWSLQNIPGWLGHVDANEDGMGLADVVFPAFLFIVGLSLPYSTDNRRARGDSDLQLFGHVVWRTVALIIMGVFLVNGETINGQATGVPRLAWNSICCLSFILIWNSYPSSVNRMVMWALRATAIIALVTLAIIYRGGDEGSLYRFGTHWWGILGLIGWAYLVAATVTILARNRIGIIVAAWAFFSLISILFHAGYIPDALSFLPGPIVRGTLTALTLGGVATALIFNHYRIKGSKLSLTSILFAMASLMIVLYFITRPLWGISKIHETPAWLFICSALTIFAFLLVYWLTDVWRKESWFAIIKPAGTATLLCYLIPYFAYAITVAAGFSLPDFALTGAAGLIKSFLFAILCALITGALIRLGLRFRV